MPTFDEIKVALTVCMKAEPPIDFVLSKDSSQLGTVFGEMMHFDQTERSLETLTPKQVSAYKRWAAPASPALPNEVSPDIT